MKIGWRFPPLSGGTKQGYTNNDIEGFKGEELIDNLAREICQNSLDARDKNSLEPVKVVFELKHVERDKYDVFHVIVTLLSASWLFLFSFSCNCFFDFSFQVSFLLFVLLLPAFCRWFSK